MKRKAEMERKNKGCMGGSYDFVEREAYWNREGIYGKGTAPVSFLPIFGCRLFSRVAHHFK
jgi:hypothetical protein